MRNSLHPLFHSSCRNGLSLRSIACFEGMGIERRLPKRRSTRVHPLLHPVPPACLFLHYLALGKHPSRPAACKNPHRGVGGDIPTGRTPVCAGRSGAPLTGGPPCREQGWSPTPPALHRSEATTSRFHVPGLWNAHTRSIGSPRAWLHLNENLQLSNRRDPVLGSVIPKVQGNILTFTLRW